MANGNSDEFLLHVFVLPWLSPSHIVSLLDIAILFAQRPGVRTTIVTTPGNVFRFRRAIDEATRSGYSIDLLVVPFPSAEVGLPEGIESTASISPTSPYLPKFFQAFNLLKQPIVQLIRDHCPDCIVSDLVYTWTSDLGVPRVMFDVSSPFTHCIWSRIADAVLSGALPVDDDGKPFVLSGGGLPHRFEFTRSEVPTIYANPGLLKLFQEDEKNCFGVLSNSFYELTPEYIDYYDNVLGGGRRKYWCLGPVWMCHKTELDKAGRGGGDGSCNIDGTNWERIKIWLDSQDRESVAFVCFGTEYPIGSHDQLREIASGLESSGRPFIWVVPKDDDSWLPQGFEERLREKCLIIRGWAPQLQILNHPATGAFVTHCGWNSTVEGVSAGVPMIAWPLHSEQFINERLIVQVREIGVRAVEGAARTVSSVKPAVVEGEALSRAMSKLMGDGEEAKAMRKRAKEYKEMARSAMEDGGSSHANLSRLIEELTVLAREKKKM